MQYTLKKSLGQHFLHDDAICRRIVEALLPLPTAALLEVGPGAGAITQYLHRLPETDFLAAELDREKVDYLQQKFPGLKDKIWEGDFLQMPQPFGTAFSLVGNFPYNISTQIVFKILEWKSAVPFAVGMFQKEVAERIAAKPGSKTYGILSVLTQAFYEVEYLFDVPPAAFQPPPKVMSGVIRLVRRETPEPMASEKQFFMLVKAAFGQRRKMLRNPLKPYFSAAVLAEPIFTQRPEQLSVAEFAALSFRLNT